MSQRSYSNERYRKGANVGSTRKSAAKAKPVRKQGSVEVSKTVKPKKKNEIEKDWSGLPTSPQIKKWRTVWWVLLLAALVMIAASWALPEIRNNEQLVSIVSVVVLLLSSAAILIDIVVIRKLRKELVVKAEKKPSPKHEAHAAAEQGSGTKHDPKDAL
jgi:hypothetical protein